MEWDVVAQKHAAEGFRAYIDHWINYDHDIDGKHTGEGRTYLIAAMRAYVSSKFGEEVPD